MRSSLQQTQVCQNLSQVFLEPVRELRKGCLLRCSVSSRLKPSQIRAVSSSSPGSLLSRGYHQEFRSHGLGAQRVVPTGKVGRVRRWKEPGEGRKQKERERQGKKARNSGSPARGPQQPRLSGPEPGGSSPGAGRAHAAPGARGPSRAAGSGRRAAVEVRSLQTLG